LVLMIVSRTRMDSLATKVSVPGSLSFYRIVCCG